MFFCISVKKVNKLATATAAFMLMKKDMSEWDTSLDTDC